MLEVRNLSVAYGGLRALTDVSLSVAEGQFVTVVGPNGAGKSTLFKTICGIVPPVQGSISFNGNDLGSRAASERAHLGIALDGPGSQRGNPLAHAHLVHARQPVQYLPERGVRGRYIRQPAAVGG